MDIIILTNVLQLNDDFVLHKKLNMYIDRNNNNDEVQRFCKENNIEYSWDWNSKNGTWNEILFDGKLLMQITQGITAEQFKNVITILSNNFYATEFPDNGMDFTVCMKQNKEYENLFAKFLERNAYVFKICV